jgi:nucleoside-diphosphate-sugar epimerase
MEQLPKYAMSNNYLESKLRFYNQFQLNEYWAGSNLHIQMHTLYGGRHIHSHMFLGQIYSSLMNQEPFKMSGGEQIREYHHLDDVANAIRIIGETQESGVRNISSGAPEKLKNIAKAIFSHFDVTPLLNLSSERMNENDNRDLIFKKPTELKDIAFRPTIQNIIGWLEELGVKNVTRS